MHGEDLESFPWWPNPTLALNVITEPLNFSQIPHQVSGLGKPPPIPCNDIAYPLPTVAPAGLLALNNRYLPIIQYICILPKGVCRHLWISSMLYNSWGSIGVPSPILSHLKLDTVPLLLGSGCSVLPDGSHVGLSPSRVTDELWK